MDEPHSADRRIVALMRISTWNLLHGISLSGNAPGEVTADGLAQASLLGCDVLAIQEVDCNQIRSNHVHQTLEIARATGLNHWCYAPAITGTPGEEWAAATDVHLHHHTDAPVETTPRYGNALLSRFPMSNIEILRFAPSRFSMPLLVPGTPRPQIMKVADEPRVAILAELDTPHGVIHVATAHLSFIPGTNVRQLKALAKALKKRAGSNPAFLIGDFNLPGRIPTRVASLPSLARCATYPTPNPKIQFDHILAQGLSIEQIEIARASAQNVALEISDHRALTIDVWN